MLHLRLLPSSLLLLLYTIRVYAQGSVTDYAPTTGVKCPTDTPLVRTFSPSNQTLHPQETAYVHSRETGNILDAWKTWLGNGSNIQYNLTAFNNNFPRVGIAFSGGGFRAAQYGAGVISALDARNDSAKAAGTGGLMQVASYMAGLSGGSWLTSSLYANEWPTIPELIFGNNNGYDGWLLDLDLVVPDGFDIFSEKNQAFYGSLLWSVKAKADKGFDTSITDPWSRALSFHFLNQTSRNNFFTNDSAHGAGQLWSNIPLTNGYRQQTVPFPIILADSRPVGTRNTSGLIALDAVVYEISPLELASFDPKLSAAVNLTYVGTNMTNGKPQDNGKCITGFDEIGFVMGTSSSLFSELLNSASSVVSGIPSLDYNALLQILQQQLQIVRTRAEDVANWPNPFQGIASSTFEDSDDAWLELLDGGLNGEVIPLGPLLVKARGVDMIVAVEASSDDDNHWPNGTSLVFTQQRISSLLQSSHQQLPPIPNSGAQFISTGTNQRPTFFGCDPQQNPPEYPLVVYLPNSPPLNGDNPFTNTDTYKLLYSQKESLLFLDQAHANNIGGFVPNSNSPDPNFGKCMQCAAVDRGRLKVKPPISRSDICSQCFKQYCYDPQNPPSNSALPNRKLLNVDPDPQEFAKVTDFVSKNKAAIIGGAIGAAILIAAAIIIIRVVMRRRRPVKYKKLKDPKDINAAAQYELPLNLTQYDPHPERRSYFSPTY